MEKENSHLNNSCNVEQGVRLSDESSLHQRYSDRLREFYHSLEEECLEAELEELQERWTDIEIARFLRELKALPVAGKAAA